MLIFLRGPGAAHAAAVRAAGARLGRVRTGSDYLREIVHQFWTSGEEVSLVPLAVLRGRGMRRKESRLATLVYSVQEMPGEIRRLVSLLWNLRETSISVGVEVPVREITRQYQREGEERVVRRLTRALQIFLYREERVVWGPPLLPKRQVRQRALQDDDVRAVIRTPGGEARAAGVAALAPGGALLRRDGGELPRHLLLVPGVRLQPHLAAPLPGLRVLRARQGAGVR